MVDPLAEKFVGLSPCNYALNSPVNVIDPDGMEAIPLDGQVTFGGYVGDDGTGKSINWNLSAIKPNSF